MVCIFIFLCVTVQAENTCTYIKIPRSVRMVRLWLNFFLLSLFLSVEQNLPRFVSIFYVAVWGKEIIIVLLWFRARVVPSPPSYVLFSQFAWLPRHPFMQWLPRRQSSSVAENDFMLVF